MKSVLLLSQRPTATPDGDDEVSRRVQALLADNSHLKNRSLGCSYHEGILVLSGHLPCYYHKQIAQNVAASVTGVEQVVNLIDVVS